MFVLVTTSQWERANSAPGRVEAVGTRETTATSSTSPRDRAGGGGGGAAPRDDGVARDASGTGARAEDLRRAAFRLGDPDPADEEEDLDAATRDLWSDVGVDEDGEDGDDGGDDLWSRVDSSLDRHRRRGEDRARRRREATLRALAYNEHLGRERGYQMPHASASARTAPRHPLGADLLPDMESLGSSEDATSCSSDCSTSSGASCDTLAREGLKDYYVALNLPPTPSPHGRIRKKLRVRDQTEDVDVSPHPSSSKPSPKCVDRKRRAVRNDGRKEIVDCADRSTHYSSSRVSYSSQKVYDVYREKSSASTDSERTRSECDANGRCLRHPHVQLKRRRRVGGWTKGRWETVMVECTEWCVPRRRLY